MRIGIFANIRKKQMERIISEFFDKIGDKKYKIYLPDELSKLIPDLPAYVKTASEQEVLDISELIIAFGGDGTILRTAHLVRERGTPILGVNLGGLGFLAATSIEMVAHHLSHFASGKFSTEKRSMLQLEIHGQKDRILALNDFVVDKAGFSRVIKINTEVDGHLLNSYIADGLIISTPTGSTAYSLANGGPILLPTTPAFIINPICPHTLSNRPVVVDDSAVIDIIVQSELKRFQIFCDGRNLGSFPTGTQLTVRKAGFYVQLVKVPNQEFFRTLRSKLGWGEDFRNKQRWSYDDGKSPEQ